MSLAKTLLMPPLSRPRVIMFDLDGTLVDTMFAFADLAAEIMHAYHGQEPDAARARYLQTCGLPFRQQLELIHPEHARNQPASDEFEDRKRAICETAPMDADTRSGLAALRAQDIKLVLSSNTGQEFVDEFVTREGFAFDLALGFGSGMAKGVPHVDRTMRALAVGRAEILFVGDSLKDGDLARDAGVRFVGRLGTFDVTAFERHLPGVVTIRNVAELPGLF
jgi:phosphoglycolate phosphatase-like HAD superfamily hydrolase